MSKNSRYDKDFKIMLVNLYNSGRSVQSLSSEYGISKVTIYSWIKNNSIIFEEDEESLSLEDVRALKKEINSIKEENEILKKAMTIFAKK